MKILDRYVLFTFIKNYLISLMVLLGLYVVLDMVFNFDELAETDQKTQLVATVRDVSGPAGAMHGALTMGKNDVAQPGMEFKILEADGKAVAGTLTVETVAGREVHGSIKSTTPAEVHRNLTATAPAPAASTGSIFASIISYYYHQSFLFFVQLSGVIPVVAAAFTLIRMSRFNELTAILAAGVPLLRVAVPIIYASVVMNFVLLPLAQELVIPSMIPELTKKHDELQANNIKTFPVPAMEDKNNVLLNAGKYTPPEGKKPAHLDRVDLIERDKDWKVVGHISADAADYDAANSQWILVNGQRVTGLAQDEKRSPPAPVQVWKTNITPVEIALYRSSDFVELLATEKINELLQHQESYGVNNLMRVKHFRWSQLLVNIVLLLLAIPCVLTREPGTLKIDVIKCVLLTGSCMAFIFLAHQIAGNPPAGAGEKWRNQWPLMMAWVPIFIFLPLAIYLLDQKHAKRT